MSTRSKPFAQYATVLSDGRTAVEVAVFDPFLVTVVLVASSKRDALDRVRSLGGRNVHVAKGFRPGHRTVDEFLTRGVDGVFAPEPFDGTWLPLPDLPAFLDGTSRHLARYDQTRFDRRWVRGTGESTAQ
ncbi:hypothetical protein [Curtobacterium sp. VKM Ac-2922]|uniref:hypothetical protein n=1 Tax=Curtobacterium sp. VKM Ac-2922 TaxID=2929475 RepID=UPI001FB36971|nr:hypothetical protein [Curtobacterium sp. VKM Ac-2922]MCJ1714375.1 hypothetical protein [Curtobacterium sp. VKM Ac-2922]